MSDGDTMLDGDGNVILDAAGNELLDDGASCPSCCSTSTNTQARRCSDDTLANLWVAGAVVSRVYALRASNGLCYYFDPADVQVGGSVGPSFDFASVTPADCNDGVCAPCTDCTVDNTPSGVTVSIGSATPCAGCFNVSWDSGNVHFGVQYSSGSVNGTYTLSKINPCFWEYSGTFPVTFDYYDAPGCAGGGGSVLTSAAQWQITAQRSGGQWAIVITVFVQVDTEPNEQLTQFFGLLTRANCRGTFTVSDAGTRDCLHGYLFSISSVSVAVT